MAEMLIDGQVVTVFPYYECSACGYRTPASGGDRHEAIMCPCKGGLLKRHNSRVAPSFPRTGFEGRIDDAKIIGDLKDATGPGRLPPALEQAKIDAQTPKPSEPEKPAAAEPLVVADLKDVSGDAVRPDGVTPDVQ